MSMLIPEGITPEEQAVVDNDLLLLNKQKKDLLTTSLANGMRYEPKDRARTQAVASGLGLPVPVVENNRDDYERTLKLSGINRGEFLYKSPVTSRVLSDMANAEVMHRDIAGLVNLEDNHAAAEAARVDAENAKSGRGVLAGLSASLAGGGASLLAMPGDLMNTVASATLSQENAAEFRRLGEATNPIYAGIKASEKWLETKKRATESALVKNPITGEETINWGAVNPISAHGVENIANMVAGEALPMLAQYLLAAATAPVTGGTSVAAATASNAGRLAKAGRFAKAVWAYAKSPVSIVNAGRVITGQANEGVRDLMSKGMTENEAWSKVAPGALLSGLFSAAAGSPLEAKVMEDLFTKFAVGSGTQTFLRKAATRLKTAAEQGLKEGAQEVMEGLGEDLAAYITYQPDKTTKEWAANAIMNFVGGASMGGVMGGSLHGAHAIHAQENANFIGSLNDESLRAQMPKNKLGAFVTELTKNGNLETLAVDGAQVIQYYQSIGEDPKAKALQLGVSEADYDFVAKNGTGDLIIPTGKYAEHIAGTDDFDHIYQHTRVQEGGATVKELAQSYSQQQILEASQKSMATLTPDTLGSAEFTTLKGRITEQLGRATSSFSPSAVEKIADSFARLMTVSAQRSKLTPMQLYEKTQLNITHQFHEMIASTHGVDYAFTDRSSNPSPKDLADGGPQLGDRSAAGLPPQESGRVASDLSAADGRVQAAGRRQDEGRLPEQPSGKAGVGPKPQPTSWHGARGQIEGGALKAEGLGSSAPGSMGPGLHISAGPHVSEAYTEGNQDGLWRVGVKQAFTPFDASLESSYSPEQAAGFGVTATTSMSGSDLWFALSKELGSHEAAAEFLQSKGFDGLYYNHGGEDAWSVWKDSMLSGSKPTTMDQAVADYQRLGSRRDELGMLKLAQTLPSGVTNLDSPTGGIVDRTILAEEVDLDPRDRQRQLHQSASGDNVPRVTKDNGGLLKAASWAYSRELHAAGSGPRVLGVNTHETWKLSPAAVAELAAQNIAAPDVHELDFTDPSAAVVFHDAIESLKDGNPYAASVHVYDVAEYAGMRLFLNESGEAGFALKPDGDIISVFSKQGSTKGAAHTMLEVAKQAGGSKLDCFDTVLPYLYAKHGFQVAARMAWNDEYAPTGWDKPTFGKFNGGEPDVLFAALSSEPKLYAPTDGKLVDDYDVAVALQAELQQESGTTKLYQTVSLRDQSENLRKFGLDPNGKYTVREVASALEARQLKKYGGISPTDRSVAAQKKIAKWMVEEVMFEQLHPERSGVGWYSEKFQRALDVFSGEFPEIGTDKPSRDLLTALIAITSDGQKVFDNFRQAVDIYGNYKKTGLFTTDLGYHRMAAININLENLTNLVKTKGLDGMRSYLTQEATVSELGKLAKAEGVKFSTDYQAHIKIPMAAIVFGPKLGAFYANLMGSDGYLTMDRWWSRTFNRYRGDLIPEPTRPGLDRFKQLLGKPQVSDEVAIAETVKFRKSYEAKDFKQGTEIEKAANTIWKAAFESLNDTPNNATDRTFMLDTVEQARKNLLAKGVKMSVADIQATLWYYEKRLYGELGARQSADVSYEEAAKRVSEGRTGSEGPNLQEPAAATAEAGVGAVPGEAQLGDESFRVNQAGDSTKEARGYLEFGANPKTGEPRQFNLILLEAEDKSTVFHELGHFYLELLGDMAQDNNSDQSVRDDYATIMKWFGVTDRSQVTRGMHERFADGHLQYILEGKAPVEELRSSFGRFSNWLYKLKTKLDERGQNFFGVKVNMTDEVRGVFDRLYASEQEIEAAKGQFTQLFTTAEQAKMTQAEFKSYSELLQKGVAASKDKLVQKLMKELEIQQKVDYKSRLEGLNEQALEHLIKLPEYQATFALREGQLADGTPIPKFDRALLVEKYGGEVVNQMDRKLFATEGGVDADAVALALGAENGDTLVQQLTGLSSIEDRAKVMSQEAMEQQHPSLLKDSEALRAEAIRLLSTEMVEMTLTTELRKLRELQRVGGVAEKRVLGEQAQAREDRKGAEQAQAQQDRSSESSARAAQKTEKKEAFSLVPKLAALRLAAENLIAGKVVWAIRPQTYLNDQRSASNASAKALVRKDYRTAAEMKEKELLNHYLYMESTRAKDEAETFRAFLKRNDSSTVRAKLGKAGGDYLAQFDAVRDLIGIERLPNKKLSAENSLRGWADSHPSGDAVVAEWMTDPNTTVNFRELTLRQMRDVKDTLVNIKHLAYLELGTIIEGKRVEYADMIEELRGSFEKNLPGAKPTMLASDPRRDKVKTRAANWLMGMDAAMVKVQLLVNWIDGNDVKGPMHRFVWDRLAKAQHNDYLTTLKINKLIFTALEKMPRADMKSMDEGQFTIPGFDGNRLVSRSEILAILLYNGQPDRKTKLLEGYATRGLNESNMQEAFTHLTDGDLSMAEHVWAAFDTLKPDILDLEQRLKGIRPEWSEATPVKVYDKNGALRAELTGGYFPLVADPSAGEIHKKQEGGTVQQIMTGNGYSRAITSSGHTKALTGAAYPLSLKFQQTLTSELQNQIKDLTHREAVLSINRLFTNKEFQTLMVEHMGEKYEDQLMPWLENIASDKNAGASRGMSAWNSMVLGARANVVSAVLGFKFTSVVVQFADISRVIAPGDYRVGTTRLANAYLKLMSDNKSTVEMIKSMSPEMEQRELNLDRDMRARLQELKGQSTAMAKANRWGFHALYWMDSFVSWATWLGSYQQGMAEHGDTSRAAKEADRTVGLKLMSGAPKDITRIQGNKNELWKLATMFMGDANANYNALRNAGHNINGIKGIPTFTAAAMAVMVGALLGDMLKGQWPDEPTDPEEWAKWAARKSLLAPFGTVPIVRDAAQVYDNIAAGKPFTDYKFSPALQAAQKVLIAPVINTIRFAEDKDDFGDYAINMGESLGYALGAPGTAQATASSKYLKRFSEGEEAPANPAEFTLDVVRGKRKER